MKTNLLTVENVVKLCGGVIAICGLYYALDKRLALMEQKFDYYIAMNESKEVEARAELTILKENDKEAERDMQKLKERIIKICAILPKQPELTDEN